MSSKIILPFLGAFFLMQTSCQDEQKDTATFPQEQLIGRWELLEAFRNGKKTETLTDTFYEFSDSGKMQTNLTITATTEQFAYQFDGSEIIQKGGSETVFKVENLNDTTLTLSMTINKFPFKLVMAKAEPKFEATSEDGILQ